MSGGDERANSWCISIMNDEQSEYALHLNAAGGAALKKISVTHVIKLGFAPKAYPPWQYKYCK